MARNISSTEQLVALFHRAAHLAFHNLHRQGSHAQDRVMALLASQRAMSQRELLQHMGVRPASLSELLGKLEKSGAVRRERDRRDKRNVVVTLTEEGGRMAAERARTMRNAMRGMFAPLAEEEQAQLAALLTRLVTAWEAEHEADPACAEPALRPWRSLDRETGEGGHHDRRS